MLSGYLIASQIFKGLKNGSFSLREFFLKRFFRILPAYWVVLALYFLVPSFREWESLPPLWKLLTFTQNFGLDLREHRTFSHAWSLCIEEQFYLLLPFTLLLLYWFKAGRKAAWLLLALCVTGFALRLFCWYHFVVPAMDTDAFGAVWYKWIYYPTYNRLDGLLAGIGIAAAFQYRERLTGFIRSYGNAVMLAGLVLIVLAYIVCNEPLSFSASIFGFPLIALAFGCMLAVAASPGSALNRIPSLITSRLATLSYAIYLTHKAVIHLTQVSALKLGWASDGTPAFAMSVITTALAATMLHYSIEKPFLKLRAYLLSKGSSVVITY